LQRKGSKQVDKLTREKQIGCANSSTWPEKLLVCLRCFERERPIMTLMPDLDN